MTISIRPDLLTRVLSLGGDPAEFVNGAIEAALNGRRYVHEKTKPGPKAAVEKSGVGVYLPDDLLVWLRSQMRGPKDLSNVIADLLHKAKAAGFRAFTDETTKP